MLEPRWVAWPMVVWEEGSRAGVVLCYVKFGYPFSSLFGGNCFLCFLFWPMQSSGQLPRGFRWGFQVPCSRTPQFGCPSWTTTTPPPPSTFFVYPSGPNRPPTGNGYRSNSLTSRPRMPSVCLVHGWGEGLEQVYYYRDFPNQLAWPIVHIWTLPQ